MGVAGLWEVLRPAGQVRSLTEIAVEDGFNANPSCQRGFRIGIDASIWFFHATYGREGENPELRTLFFRCCRLLQLPFLPLFVFDGPNRPAIKRGKRVGANAHWLTQGMKNIIDAFGFEWWVAPGEAEAELAYLNRIGFIDAVLSDDVDNFLFGATIVIRNPSNTLSGNRAHPVKNAQGKDDGNHVVVYTTEAILSDSSVALSRSGTILIGLLSGGDYIPAGLPGCGQKFATGLARAGFGDSLLKAVKDYRGTRLDTFLDEWRRDLRNELKTNKSGFLPSKKPSLAASLPDDFPSLPVLMSYADPLTSENPPQKGKRKTLSGRWRNDPDPMRIASLCELYFEWGVKDVIVHRFRTVLWPGIVCRAVRRAVVDADTRRVPTLNGSRRLDSEEEDGGGPPSPTKRISSALSVLTLQSPSKKPPATNAFASNPPSSESFTLSSLVTLTDPAIPDSSRPTFPSSPSSPASGLSPLLLEVLSQRTHASTDSILEYRVLVDPTTLVERAESGVKGLRPPLIGGLFGIDPEDEDGGELDEDADESGGGSDGGIERLETAAGVAFKSGTKRRKARREVPAAPLRLWLPACMIRAAAPALVGAYEEKARVHEEKKSKRGTKGRRGGRARTEVKSTSRRTKDKDAANDEGDLSVPGPSATRTAAASKKKPKAIGVGGRRKPKQASEAQDDAYECFDLSAGQSSCSSDGDGNDLQEKGAAKAKTRQTGFMKPTAEASVETDTTNRKATTSSTMKEFFSTKKPSTMKAIGSKSSTSRPLASKSSKLNYTTSNHVYEKEEESTDVDIPPPLPKSSRPLDLLRAKSKSAVFPLEPTFVSKPTAAPRHEEESFPSSPRLRPSRSKPVASSLPCQPTQQAPPAKKTPLFVDVSDTDSDIVLSDVRRSLFGTRATITSHEKVGSSAASLDSEDADSDTVEIVDVFTVPRRPSSLRSPVSSPSPVKSLSNHVSTRPAVSVKSVRSDGFPSSPINSISQISTQLDETTNPRRRVSSDGETCTSGNERNGIPKSPRKSAAHSSPRHASHALGHVSSPTKPRESDTSAICISSGSEDDHHAKVDVSNSRGRGVVEVNEDQDGWTDWDADVDGLADTGMILSVPPTPATSTVIPYVPATGVTQKSRFKPASGGTTSTGLKNARDDDDTAVPHPVHCAPLLAARAKQCKGKDDDVIDLTSD